MNSKLKDLLKFVEFTNLFSDIQRKTILNKNGTPENNAQHSFQLAIVAWFIIDSNQLDLNLEKIIRFALVHDLVETYSGTFPAYSRSEKKQELKNNSEGVALRKIKNDFKDFENLIIYLDEYLALETNEAKFIYALDKLLPIINIELNNNDFYSETQTTYEQMLEVKDAKISQDPTVHLYFELLCEYLSSETKFFWPENQERDYSEKEYKFE